MAQVLKDEQRIKILESAKMEFLQNGIPSSTMRLIAKNAGTTVGNLYRYYKNKQEIVDAILMPVITKLNHFDAFILSDVTSMDKSKLDEYLTNWVDNLVEIQSDFPIEMHIIVNDEQINREYHDKLVLVITGVVSHAANDFIRNEHAIDMMSRMIAQSIFAGIREGVSLKCNETIGKEDFRKILKKFMENFFLFLENIR